MGVDVLAAGYGVEFAECDEIPAAGVRDGEGYCGGDNFCGGVFDGECE